MFCFLGGNCPNYKLKDEKIWDQPKEIENYLNVLKVTHSTEIMSHYSNMTDSWEKMATMVTDIWFACPNLEVGERLKNEMLEGGNVYFYRFCLADNTLNDMTLGIVVFSLN
jgi:carboxylesterase type B